MMRMAFITMISMAMFPVVSAQTSADFQSKYGKPVAETYIVRSGIKATVSRLPDGKVQEIIIAPELPSDLTETRAEIPYTELKGIINEIVPRSERGVYKMGTFLNITCLPKNDCGGSMEEYEKLSIYYKSGIKGADYAVIRWKKSHPESESPVK